MITLCVKGNPQALKRHRTFQRGKFTGTYDPSKGDKADFLTIVQEKAPLQPYVTPLKVELRFYFSRPNSHYGTGRNARLLKPSSPAGHTKRPDLDNLIKFVLDALNGVFWKDDTIVTQIIAEKDYAPNPRTEIIIRSQVEESEVSDEVN